MTVYLNGLMLGLSLIMALGPQNIFIIRQGTLRQHAVLSAITCFLCDILLVTASVAGLHHVLELHPDLGVWLSRFGVAFLGYYGSRALIQAFNRSSKGVKQGKQLSNRWQIVLLALSFSLLNPHAIVDSLVLIGGGSGQFPDHQQAFLAGVITSSLLWFTVLTSTTYYFSNALSRTAVWRRVEFFSGTLMVYLSVKLLCSQF